MKQVSAVFALAGFVSTMALAAGAYAEDAAWSAEVVKVDGSASAAAIYTPLAKAAKPWRVCVLFPHMKDSIWLAVDYGITEEAKRLGITEETARTTLKRVFQKTGVTRQSELSALLARMAVR